MQQSFLQPNGLFFVACKLLFKLKNRQEVFKLKDSVSSNTYQKLLKTNPKI